MTKKGKFVKEGKQIYFKDKHGRAWDDECLDELFDAISKRKSVESSIDYYTYPDSDIEEV